MINKDDLKEIIDHCKGEGVSARVRDIAYVILTRTLDSPQTAYQCLFGTDGFEEYQSSRVRRLVEEYMVLRGFVKSDDNADGENDGITFEENRREMERLLERVQEELANGTIEARDALRIEGDIRVKLNDKFNISEQQQERVIIVQAKYNDVCAHCGHEIYIPTKEQLMKEYNLIENIE